MYNNCLCAWEDGPECKSTYTKPGNLSSVPDIYMVEEEK